MKVENKSYYAIIPANIRYCEKITANAKLLYGEITALANEKGYCWASNNYFSKLYKVSKQTVSEWIRQLKENNFILIEMEYKYGSKEILNRYIRIPEYPIVKKPNTPIVKKPKDNITKNNITINNTLDKSVDNSINNYNIYKNEYNLKLLILYKDQSKIDNLIYSDKKERQNMAILLKKFNSITECQCFFQTAFNDKWLKENGFLPSLLNSQFSKIKAMVELNNKKQIDINNNINNNGNWSVG